jgi:hypothetical protein
VAICTRASECRLALGVDVHAQSPHALGRHQTTVCTCLDKCRRH